MEIYVRNLAYEVEEGDLQKAFAEHGEVRNVSVIRDHETGRSRGFGFVNMPNDAEAKAAIAALDGQPVRDRAVYLSEARPRSERPPPGGPRHGSSQPSYSGDSRPTPSRRPGSPSSGSRPYQGVASRAFPPPRPSGPPSGDREDSDASEESDSDRKRARDAALRAKRSKLKGKKPTGRRRFEDGGAPKTGTHTKKRRQRFGDDDDEDLQAQYHIR